MRAPRLACLSVDLDSLPHYCRIHGLDERGLPGRARTLVYDVALPRFLALFDEVGAPATLFAIGEDAELEPQARALGAAVARGHEVGNHSYAHDYALSRRAPGAVADDVRRAHEVLTRATGTAPVGFRAPGYTLSAPLHAAYAGLGYRYGSSAFPAAPYYLGKAAVMGALALTGHPSRAVLDSPRVLLAPRTPYVPDPVRPYARGEGGVLELPMAVSRVARFPFIGTFVATLPRRLVRALYRGLAREAFLNLEMHGVDLLDASDGIPAELVSRQRDLRVPVARKRAQLAEVFRALAQDYDVVTLAVAAGRLGGARSTSP